LGSSPGAITAAYGIFSFPDSFPHPVGGQPGNLLPVHTPGSWICRPRGSAILAGIRQQVLCSSYPRLAVWDASTPRMCNTHSPSLYLRCVVPVQNVRSPLIPRISPLRAPILVVLHRRRLKTRESGISR
jgi:hypothetical protein